METWKRNLYVCWFGVFATSLGTSQLAPILPLYVEQLGVQGMNQIESWSGIAFGVTFVTLALFSPLWGRASDKYGRKPMLLRAWRRMFTSLSVCGCSRVPFPVFIPPLPPWWPRRRRANIPAGRWALFFPALWPACCWDRC